MKVGAYILNMSIPLQASLSTFRETPRSRYNRTDVGSSSGAGMYMTGGKLKTGRGFMYALKNLGT